MPAPHVPFSDAGAVPKTRHRFVVAAMVLGLVAASVLPSCRRAGGETWQATDIETHMPDLKFNLASGSARLTEQDFQGRIVLLYFGYAHCPDVCPMTMAKLTAVLQRLGSDAQNVRILFVSVDPQRDTPATVAEYAHAFSPNATGATGTPDQVEALAKRYRVAFQAATPDQEGNYEVMHGKAVYVFDEHGRARLLISDTATPEAILHDLRQLTAAS